MHENRILTLRLWSTTNTSGGHNSMKTLTIFLNSIINISSIFNVFRCTKTIVIFEILSFRSAKQRHALKPNERL